MPSPLPSPTCDELPATTAKPYWHTPMLAGNARGRSGDLLFHGSPPRHGAHGPQVREIPLLVGASRLALSLPSSVAPSAWSHSISQSVQLRTLPSLAHDNVSMWTVICPFPNMVWVPRPRVLRAGLLNLFPSNELLNLPLNLRVPRPRVLRAGLLNLLPSREPRYRFTASISTNPGSPLA